MLVPYGRLVVPVHHVQLDVHVGVEVWVAAVARPNAKRKSGFLNWKTTAVTEGGGKVLKCPMVPAAIVSYGWTGEREDEEGYRKII